MSLAGSRLFGFREIPVNFRHLTHRKSLFELAVLPFSFHAILGSFGWTEGFFLASPVSGADCLPCAPFPPATIPRLLSPANNRSVFLDFSWA
jgi:hypothetical protein